MQVYNQVYLADTHCHLDFSVFDADRETVLENAAQQGIQRILNPGVDLETSRAALSLAESYPNVYAAVGVHPNEALNWDVETLDQLRALAQHPKVVAIGEIGLDFYRDRAPKDLQYKILQAQLELAAELGLPVIIHTRQSLAETFAVLRDWRRNLQTNEQFASKPPGVLHSFEGPSSAVEEAVTLGFMLGVSGPLTFRNAPERRSVLAAAPLTNLLIETDAPFLTPHPYRGQRNEPAFVRIIAETLADLQGRTMMEVADITSSNANYLFAWSS